MVRHLVYVIDKSACKSSKSAGRLFATVAAAVAFSAFAFFVVAVMAAAAHVGFGEFADCQDLAFEEQRHAGELVVEVDFHEFNADLFDCSWNDVSVVNAELQCVTDFAELVERPVFVEEHVFFHGVNHLFVAFAVTFGWREVETECVARLKALQTFLESRQEHAVAENAFKRMLFRGLVDDLAFNRVVVQCVSQCDYCVVSYFHFTDVESLCDSFLMIYNIVKF